MTGYLLAAAAVIFACVLFNKVSNLLGIPVLLAFILLGMVFGSDGLVKIAFDNYAFAGDICSIALIFIMFYGGFGTKWEEARPVVCRAALLSSLGTVITALLVGVFCRFVLHIALLESFLIGAVISSTDAASVFSILRSKRLNLRDGTASLLEVESGSNDPVAYMLTVVLLSLMNGGASAGRLSYLLFSQIVYGAAFGVAAALLAVLFLRHVRISSAGFDAIFILAVALAAYALPAAVGGNGYLSVYITGIILGNSRIGNKQALVHFYDGMTGLMQMLLFFLLGLLSFPSQLPFVALTALAVALFMTFIARPVAVFAVLAPFRCSIRQMLLVSWSGMRGAASIVFAILAVINPAVTDNDLFHIVFFIVLFSILVQGTLLPYFSRWLQMTDEESDVMKTFTDYTDEVPVQFLQFTVSEGHPWAGKAVRNVLFPPDSILVLLIRGGEKMVPNGGTVLEAGDTLVLSGRATGRIDGVNLYEKTARRSNGWAGKTIAEIPSGNNKLVIMIRRGDNVIIPHGTTRLQENDVLVINDTGAASE